MNWVKLVEWIPHKFNQEDTYPSEGISVLVTDGKNYDVAWYSRSSEYRWVKNNIKEDGLDDFVNFIPTHWKEIEKLDENN